jgi:anthranilate phosphoribosyltransferase
VTDQAAGRPETEQAASWPEVLTRLLAGTDLSTGDAAWAMDQVMSGQASPAQLGAFLAALRAKGETVAEMRGLADTMLQHAHRFAVPGPALDVVGTGGDRAHTVNISTMSAVVAAAAGVRVVKHGNRAASSSSGSADMLEALGIRLDQTPELVEQTLATCGITFCFAQTFHPSMRHAAAVRRELGIATAFNFLGPLTNPGQPRYVAVGVADPRMAPLVAGVFAGRSGSAAVFRGDDGLDEITTATTTHVWWVDGGEVTELTFDPERAGLPLHPVEALRGGDAAHNAQVATRVFAGEAGAVRDAVLLNAGMALAVLDAGESGARPGTAAELHTLVRAGVDRAAEAIDRGGAERVVHDWIASTSR